MTNEELRAQLHIQLRKLLEETQAEAAALIRRQHPEYQRILGLLADLTDDRGVSGYPPEHSVRYTGPEFLTRLIEGHMGPPRL